MPKVSVAKPKMQELTQAVARIWGTPSSTDPSKTYLTLQATDGTLACSCPGWAFNTRCWHTQAVADTKG